MNIKERYKIVIEIFSKEMPVAETELHFRTTYELIVAVILSAQCTDKRVNIITPEFFKSFPTAQILSEAKVEDIFDLIKSCSYPNNKAKNLLGMAQVLTNEYHGLVPDNLEDLQKMPGVGRKTANVIMSVAFGKPTMAVDTHVFRVAERIGLSIDAKNPLQTELQLTHYFPEDLIPKAHHWLILHGRYICKARKPQCSQCFIKDVCKSYPSFQEH
ncbi:MAG: endonuclease III [Bacteroidetes bacterium CG2_30_33_31]|nr:MAG: endonuclease III [Bacteroidetes bacterium CG2_30_33_31]